MKNAILVSGIVIALGVSSTAIAQTSSGSFKASTSVQSECKIVALGDIDFFDLDAMEALGGSMGRTFSIQCTGGTTNVLLSLDEGSNPETSSSCANPKRRMQSQYGNYLTYDLMYSDVNGATMWGCDSSNQVVIPTFVSSGTPVSVNRRAVWHQGQDLPIGSYVDTVNLTVAF